MMRYLRIYFLIGIALFAAACNSKEKPGAGDATIEFAQSEYRFSEIDGLVKIPVKIEGEPRHYPITFDVKATPLDGIEDLSDLVHFTQIEGLKYVGIPNAPANIEFQIKDDDAINGTRSFLLNIIYAEGAEVHNSSTTVYIENDDFEANPTEAYERLQGDWNFTATGVLSGERISFDVNISGGFSDSERADNLYKRLVCWGFAEEKDTYEGVTLSHQPVWYITIDGQSNQLSIQTGTMMTSEIEFEVEGWTAKSWQTVAISLYPASPEGNISFDTPIKGTWSNDYNTITFDPNYGFGAMILADSVITNYFMDDIFYQIVLTRK